MCVCVCARVCSDSHAYTLPFVRCGAKQLVSWQELTNETAAEGVITAPPPPSPAHVMKIHITRARSEAEVLICWSTDITNRIPQLTFHGRRDVQ